MSDQAIIERLAEFMGWKKVNMEWGDIMFQKPPLKICFPFDPLHDWNDWRQVEEKVMKNKELFELVLHQFWNDKGEYGAYHYVLADLPTRCKALCAALDYAQKP